MAQYIQKEANSMLRMIGYGFIVWVIPYISAIPLLPLMNADPTFFKTLMIVEGSIVGAICAVLYFGKVEKDFLKEGVILGIVWLALNWLLDYFLLLPLSKMPLGRYFIEIGLRYIGMLASTVAIGFVLASKLKK
jgi:uncharacterized membrane protein YpjA